MKCRVMLLYQCYFTTAGFRYHYIYLHDTPIMGTPNCVLCCTGSPQTLPVQPEKGWQCMKDDRKEAHTAPALSQRNLTSPLLFPPYAGAGHISNAQVTIVRTRNGGLFTNNGLSLLSVYKAQGMLLQSISSGRTLQCGVSEMGTSAFCLTISTDGGGFVLVETPQGHIVLSMGPINKMVLPIHLPHCFPHLPLTFPGLHV